MRPTSLQRALELAPTVETPIQERPPQEYFCFRLGDWCLGVPSANVREVFRLGPLTPLPRIAPFVLGVCGHRGEVLPVLDLLRLLGKGDTKLSPRSRVFVGLAGSYTAAVLTEGVLGLQSIVVDEVVPPPIGSELLHDHLLGVAQRKPQVSLLNFTRLLQVAQQKVVAR